MKTTMMTRKTTRRRRTWGKIVLRNEEVENGCVDKKRETKEVLMYYQNLKVNPWQKREREREREREFSNALLELYSTYSWNMLKKESFWTLEDFRIKLRFIANAGFTFTNRNIDNILVFEEERHLVASILEMKNLEKVKFSVVFLNDLQWVSP